MTTFNLPEAPEAVSYTHLEAPNLYPQLSDAEKKQVDKIKYKIFNFIDKRDLVTWEHSEEGNEGVVGTLVRIDSKDAGNLGKQHMWGGYDYLSLIHI